MSLDAPQRQYSPDGCLQGRSADTVSLSDEPTRSKSDRTLRADSCKQTTGETEVALELELPPLGRASKIRAGVLCFREVQNASSGSPGRDQRSEGARVEILLVSRRSHKASLSSQKSGTASAHLGRACETFSVPAGKFEFSADSSFEDCALREAREEAGIECECVADLGWHHSIDKHDKPIETRYFLARCLQMLDTWQEDGERERVWFSEDEAIEKVSYRSSLQGVIMKGLHLLHHKILGGNGLQICGEHYTCYSKQVGGHFAMVKPAPGSVIEVVSHFGGSGCGDNYILRGNKILLKPCDQFELSFYCQLPHRLEPFVPHFYGTKTLRREQIEQLAGEVKQSPPCETSRVSSINGKAAEPQREYHDLLKHCAWCCGGSAPSGQRQTADSGFEQKAGLRTADRSAEGANSRKYIVLEDLSANFEKACFLDIKMGCRQRAARHNSQKQSRMAKKAELSTTAKLGFRICGMHCLDFKSGSIQKYDKYYGQKVSKELMCEALSLFFCFNSPPKFSSKEWTWWAVWHELVSTVLRRLDKLYELVLHLPGIRFWSSSLLVGFDGALALKGHKEAFLNSIRVKMIDFAHFQEVGGEQPDQEYLFGLRNLRLHLSAILERSTASNGTHGSGMLQALGSPPLPTMQDQEQRRARDALQNGHAQSSPETNNLNSNLNTISGATGSSLLRELASTGVVRRQGVMVADRIEPIMEDGLPPKGSPSTLQSLFVIPESP